MQQALLQLKAINRETCFVSGTHQAKGRSINFLGMMAANRESIGQQFGVVNIRPEYATGKTVFEALQK